jgi:hypothetical protein
MLLNTDKSNGDRVWTYQTCTEFAFYQTCEVWTARILGILDSQVGCYSTRGIRKKGPAT